MSNLKSFLHCLGGAKESVQVQGALKHFVIIKNFYHERLAPLPTPKLEDHPLLVVHDCLFNIFTATLCNRRTSLYLQPEDMSCCGDKGPTQCGGGGGGGGAAAAAAATATKGEYDIVKYVQVYFVLTGLFMY
jgi:hypothetical protein